jgi:4-amino-4-deoxy-L-arabinose transferase-like glycosyltransferase
MTTATLAPREPFLKRRLAPGLTIATILVIAIMGLSLALHLYNIDSIGDANSYYTAAVESMLKSWSNFFFVAAEPGGSVTVDKPPLGLWIEAIFAYFLGVSGVSVSLPNILAGVFGIPVLYHLVKKYAGEMAGLIAGLVMAITPVFVATNRNNTMDGMLVFTLLLAAWAFIHATETGRARWLMLGAFIVGLGFNIKMMQAFLPLPAFYALYFLGSKEGWVRKTINLGLATVLLLVVSLSWAVAVDLTPADQRPYIGSSDNNTVLGLMFGHNGISRLENTGRPGGGGQQGDGSPPAGPGTGPASNENGPRNGPPQAALEACASGTQGTSCSFSLPNGNTIDGSCITPPNSNELACAPAGGPGMQGAQNGGPQGPDGQGGGPLFSRETGEPGVLRFFTSPLSKQMSWLLPFALISVLVALFSSRIRLPIESGIHKALLLWGGWLLTCVVFFSMVSGIFHAYYAIMLAPALGAMVGIGFDQLWTSEKKWAGALLIGAAVLTLGFQFLASHQYGEITAWTVLAGILLIAGSLLMVMSRRWAYVTLLTAMLVIPAYWTAMTSVASQDINLPTAYGGSTHEDGPDGLNRARQSNNGGPNSGANEELLDYLQENTQEVKYMVAVPSSQQGASLVLETGRPVLYMGGFGGQDRVVSAADLDQMVADKELRYVLYGQGQIGQEDIVNWLDESCFVIQQFEANAAADGSRNNMGGSGPGGQALSLYMCN